MSKKLPIPFNEETAIKKVRWAKILGTLKIPLLYHLDVETIVFGNTEANLLEEEKKL